MAWPSPATWRCSGWRLPEAELEALVVRAVRGAAVRLRLWVGRLAAQLSNGADRRVDVGDRVHEHGAGLVGAAGHAAHWAGSLDLPAVRDATRPEPPAEHGAEERLGPLVVADPEGDIPEVARPRLRCGTPRLRRLRRTRLGRAGRRPRCLDHPPVAERVLDHPSPAVRLFRRRALQHRAGLDGPPYRLVDVRDLEVQRDGRAAARLGAGDVDL